MSQLPILYIKRGCPWCREAQAYFQQHGVELDVRDVNLSAQNMQRMVEVSGQTLTPTFEYGDCIIADFSVDEFIDQIAEYPEVRRELGIADHLEDD
ncbi:MAG: glutaredoxin domain-containing protein [Verrucomicrobiota bacterium]